MATGWWDSLVSAWTWHFWSSTACLVAGVLVLAAPFFLSQRIRRWLVRSSVDIEHVGLLVLIVVLACIGVPHHLRSASP
jgi:hypothetical protein